jgi:choline dehydrogenase-like flavoprotein
MIQRPCAFNGRTWRFFVNDRENPYATPRGKPFNGFRGRQVGGRLHTWARVAVRMSDLELKSASRDGHGVDWPISYDDLAPYYDKVEAFLGVYGSAEGIPALPDGRYLGPLALTPEEASFQARVEASFPDRRVIAARVAA